MTCGRIMTHRTSWPSGTDLRPLVLRSFISSSTALKRGTPVLKVASVTLCSRLFLDVFQRTDSRLVTGTKSQRLGNSRLLFDSGGKGQNQISRRGEEFCNLIDGPASLSKTNFTCNGSQECRPSWGRHLWRSLTFVFLFFLVAAVLCLVRYLAVGCNWTAFKGPSVKVKMMAVAKVTLREILVQSQ